MIAIYHILVIFPPRRASCQSSYPHGGERRRYIRLWWWWGRVWGWKQSRKKKSCMVVEVIWVWGFNPEPSQHCSSMSQVFSSIKSSSKLPPKAGQTSQNESKWRAYSLRTWNRVLRPARWWWWLREREEEGESWPLMLALVSRVGGSNGGVDNRKMT